MLLAAIGGGSSTPSWWRGGDDSIADADVDGAWQGIGAASQSASLTDLSGNGNTLTGTVSSWNASSGWVFTGSQNLNTGITLPPSDANITLAIRYSGAGSTAYIMGLWSGSAGGLAAMQASSTLIVYNHNDQKQHTSSANNGVAVLSGVLGYYNGSQVVSGFSFTDHKTTTVRIGGANGLFFSGSIQAAAIYNTNLSASQVSALSTAMAALS